MERIDLDLILAKAESTYATDPTPTPAANALPVKKGSISYSVSSNYNERQISDGVSRRLAGTITQKTVKLEFTLELRGNRTDGATPDISAGSSSYALRYHCLMAAAHLLAAYTAELSGGSRDGYVTYKPYVPVDEGPSVTCYFFTEKKKHILTGGKVESVEFSYKAGGFVDVKFVVMGLYNAVTDNTFATTLSTVAFEAPSLKPPAWTGAAVTYNGVTPTLETVTFSVKNEVGQRNDAVATDGVKGFAITKGPLVTGTIDPETVAEATNAYWADFASGEVDTLVVPLGTLTGNKVTITATCQQTGPGYATRGGSRTYNIPFNVVASGLDTATGAEFAVKIF